MPKDADKADRAFGELVRVLEEASKAGASCLALEWAGQELVAFRDFGGIMIGIEHFPTELESDVVDALVQRTGLDRKTKGKMMLDLLGEEYEVLVEKYGTFGEPAFQLTLKKCGRKKRPAK
ncbi:MAG: hypothetical protein ACLQNE_28900 [Thermoguttaceae bacterium]|jgi:hypothetical protein